MTEVVLHGLDRIAVLQREHRERMPEIMYPAFRRADSDLLVGRNPVPWANRIAVKSRYSVFILLTPVRAPWSRPPSLGAP